MAKILSIAANEIRRIKGVGGKELLYLFLVVILAVFLIWASFSYGTENEYIYSVASDDETIKGILKENPKIMVENPDKEYDVILNNGNINIKKNAKAVSALKNVVDAINARNNAMLELAYQENEITYYDLFPVWIKLRSTDALEELTQDSTSAGEPGEETTENDQASLEASRGLYRTRDPTAIKDAVENALTKTEYDVLTTPDELNKILPIKSIILALLIVTPIIFISTAYNNSFFEEKIEKKASLIFVSPIKTIDIVVGKSLPYFIASLAVILPMIIFFNHRPTTILLALPPLLAIVLLYFSLNFLLTVLSRSYKEISFLKTSMGSVFIAYVLLPTLFMEVSDIAFVSPLTTIAHLIEENTIALKPYVFSFLPMLFAGIVIYYFASLLVNEEHYFTNKSILEKIADMLSIFLKKPINVAFLTMLSFPLVIVIELIFLLLVVLPTKDIGFLFLLLIVVAATVEEFFKNIGIYLIYTRKLLKASPFVLGILSGAAFAFVEKSLLLIMMPELLTAYYKITLPALIVPFFFHSLTCVIFAVLVRRKKSYFTFIAPVALHIVYGITVFRVFA